jgi:Ca2+-binding EF-hand superfamily protein
MRLLLFTVTLPAVAKLSRRFESLQQGFGFGIGPALFAQLFRLKKEDEETTQRLWTCWDTDKNDVTDVLEILAGLSLVSIGSFDAKLSAVFDLFDFDSSQTLTLEELRICMRTSVAGLCKLTDTTPEPSAAEVDRVAARAFGPSSGGRDSKGGVTRQEFLEYVASVPSVVATIIRFGTTDAEATRKKYAVTSARALAATKIQSAFKSSRFRNSAAAGSTAAAGSSTAATASPSTGSVGGQRGRRSLVGCGAAGGDVFNLAAVRRCKQLFDRIDLDGSGCISVRELVASMRVTNGQAEFVVGAIEAFAALDTDGSQSLSFAEMLSAIYPTARPSDIARMVRDLAVAHRPSLAPDQRTVQRLKAWFEGADDDFDGKVPLRRAVQELAHDRHLAHLVLPAPPADGSEEEDEDPAAAALASLSESQRTASVTLAELITHLFAAHCSSPAKLEQAHRWAVEDIPAGVRAQHAAAAAAAATAALHGGEGNGNGNGNGNVPPLLSASQQRELDTLFSLFDSDGQGRISASEVRRHFAGLGGLSSGALTNLFAPHHSAPEATLDLEQFRDLYRKVTALHVPSAARNAAAEAGGGASTSSSASSAATAAGGTKKRVSDAPDMDAEYL